jgi:hypothetical protein
MPWKWLALLGLLVTNAGVLLWRLWWRRRRPGVMVVEEEEEEEEKKDGDMRYGESAGEQRVEGVIGLM